MFIGSDETVGRTDARGIRNMNLGGLRGRNGTRAR
jgi:hypothetical protein